MSLSSVDFESLSEPDLQRLVDVGVPEGVLIEYKRDTYGAKDADVKEFLKDVSSFANTRGGHLVVGIDERARLPTALVGSMVNPDTELARLEAMMSDGIEPRISAQAKAVPLAAGGHAFVIRVARSWNPPHRVTARNSNRFYCRNSAGVYEPSVDQLRVLYALGSTALERSRAFRFERLAKIEVGDTPCPLSPLRDRLVVHLVPLAGFESVGGIQLVEAQKRSDLLRPIGVMGYSPRINFEGFIVHSGGTPHTSYTQLFRNGMIEAVMVGVSHEYQAQQVIASTSFENRIVQQVPTYLEFLEQLGIPAPVVVMFSIQGIKGAMLGVSQEQLIMHPPDPIRVSQLELPEIIIDDYGDRAAYLRAFRPAFDALYNTAGLLGSRRYNEAGDWIA